MHVVSIPFIIGLLRSMIDDFEIGHFGDGFFGKIYRGRATLQFYFTGDFGEVTLQVYPPRGVILISSNVELRHYLKAVGKQHGIESYDVALEAPTSIRQKYEPVDLSTVISEIPWALMTSKERGIMIACGKDFSDGSLPQPEVSPEWVAPGINTALAFIRDLLPWSRRRDNSCTQLWSGLRQA